MQVTLTLSRMQASMIATFCRATAAQLELQQGLPAEMAMARVEAQEYMEIAAALDPRWSISKDDSNVVTGPPGQGKSYQHLKRGREK